MSRSSNVVWIVTALALAGGGGYFYLYGWPVAAQEEAEQGEPPTQVVLAAATQGDVTISVEALGDTVARESVVLTSRVAGRVEAIDFTDGQDVQAGAVLVQLDPADASDAVAGAQAGAEEALQAYERAAQLAQNGTGPQAVADDLLRQAQVAEAEAESSRARLDDYNIRVPFDGRLGLRNISLGTFIQPGTEIATLDAVDPIEIRFTVPERYLGQVVQGASVVARSPAFPEESFTGEVTAIASRIDPALRTLTLEASVPNAEGRLLPGMLMNVTLELGVREDATIVPPLSVQLQGSTHFVFRVAEDKAERVDVEIGQRSPEGVEIVSGLEPGDRVIVEGFQDLSSGQPVAERQEEGSEDTAEDAPQPRSDS